MNKTKKKMIFISFISFQFINIREKNSYLELEFIFSKINALQSISIEYCFRLMY